MLCAIALRDRAKEYSERDVLMLAEQFKTLKMSDFWEVFFSLNVHTIKRVLYIAQSLTLPAKAVGPSVDEYFDKIATPSIKTCF